jgi:hypothetical protein
MLMQDDDLGAPGFIDGVNCAVLVFGNSRSGKTFTVEGNPAASAGSRDGVIPCLINGVFEILGERQGRVGGRRRSQQWRFQLSVQYVEIVDEKIIDLLNPVKMELDVDEQGLADGLGIKNACRKLVSSRDELFHLFKTGQAARTTARSEFGALSERAASFFSLELHQVQTQAASRASDGAVVEHLYSRFMVVDLPGAEKMAEDPTTLRIREGPTLNHGVTCLAAALRALAQAKDVGDLDYADLEGSKLTRLLGDALAGPFRTACIATIPPASYQANSFTLQYASLFARIPCFPVVNDGRAVALLRKLSSQCYFLRQQLGAGLAGGARGDARGAKNLMQVAELERRIIDGDKVRLALLEEREQLREKLVQLNARANQLLGEKAQLQQERIASEEERLRVSKVLVDLQIEHTAQAEQAVDREFQLENRLLQQENAAMELRTALQARAARVGQLEEELRRAAELGEDLRAEVAATRANYSSVLSDLDSEKARCEELSIELLNLVNAKNALLRERAQARADADALQRHAAGLQERCEAAEREGRRVAEECARMEKAVEDARMELQRAQLDLESARVQFREQQLELERRFADRERSAGEELLLLRREGLERLEESRAEREALLGRAHAAAGEAKQARRRAAELEAELRARADAEQAAREEARELRERLTRATEEFREKLRQYMASMADHAAAGAGGAGAGAGGGAEEGRDGVQRMLQGLVDTHGLQERRLQAEVERARQQAAGLAARCRRLHQAYRSVRYQLEDLAPAGAALDMLDEAALGVEEAEGAGGPEGGEAERLRGLVAALEKRAADEAEAALRAAEARAGEARRAQAALAERDAVIERLQLRLGEASVHRGEVQQLEEQLLSELVSLKAHQGPLQPPPRPAAGDEAAADLRRQLDRAVMERDRLAQDLERARAAPPPPPAAAAAADLQAQVGQLQQANRALEERLRAAAAAGPPAGGGGAEAEALRGKVAALEGEVGRLQAQAAALQQEKQQLERKAAAAPPPPPAGGGGGGADTAALEAEVGRLRAKVASLEAELAKDDYKAMIADFASGTQQELEAEVSELRTRVTMLEQENADLQERLARRK